MKNIIIIIIIALISSSSLIQAQNKVEFGYDNAGNRISRTFIAASITEPISVDENTNTNNLNIDTSSILTESNIAIENNLSYLLFPNPATKIVTIQIPSSSANQKLKIYDINGKILTSIDVNSNTTHLDISKYSRGMYFVYLMDDNGIVKSWKLVKTD